MAKKNPVNIDSINKKLDKIEGILKSDVKNNLNNISINSYSLNASNYDIVNSLSTNNDYLKKINDFVQNIFSHISNFQSSNNNSFNNNNIDDDDEKTGLTSCFTNIETYVKEIYDEINKFHNDFLTYANNNNVGLSQEVSDNYNKIKDKRREEENKKDALLLAFEEILKNGNLDSNTKNILDSSKITLSGDFDKKSKNEKLKEIREGINNIKNNDEKIKKELNKKPFKDYTSKENLPKAAAFVLNSFANLGNGNLKSSEVLDKGISKISQANPLIGSILSIIKMGFDSYAKQEKLGSEYARSFGGGRYGMNRFISRESDFINKYSTLKNNYTVDEVSSALTSFTEEIGRNSLKQTNENIKSMIDLKRMGIESNTFNMFDTFGKSAEDVDKYFAQLYGDAGKKGLSFKNVSKAVKDNLKMAQTYTFSNGIKGLTKMAETSTQLKFNMNEVSKAAEKFSTFESAIKSSAELSVLGSDFSTFSNPMQLMYESLNDMEGLQDRIVKMFGNMAYFDEAKKQIDISVFDKQRIKSASQAIGVDYGEMLNLAMNNQRGKMAEEQLSSKQGLKDDTINFIKNIAQIDDKGRAYVELGGEKKYVSELSEGNRSQLQKESEAYDIEKDTKMGDIFNETRDIYDKLDQILNYLSTKIGVWVAKIAGFNEFMGNNSAEEFWDNANNVQKNKLIKKYGNKEEAKKALGSGSENKLLDEWYGGELERKFFDFKYGDDQTGDKAAALRFRNKTFTEEERKEFEEFKKNELRKNSGLHISHAGQTCVNGDQITLLQDGESVLNKKAAKSIGYRTVSDFNNGNFTSIKNTGNELNSLKVNNRTNGYNESKVKFEPLSINLNINTTIKGENGNKFELDEIAKRNISKLIVDNVKENIPAIFKQYYKLINKGFDMENYPLRNALNA